MKTLFYFHETVYRFVWAFFATALLLTSVWLISPVTSYAQTIPIENPCDQIPTESYTTGTEFRGGRSFSGVVLFEGDLILSDGTYIVEEEAILQMVPTFCQATPGSLCQVYPIPGFDMAPGQPFTRLIVRPDAHLIIEGGTITSADCQSLWGGIIVEEGGSLTTQAGPTLRLPARISQGMWGILFSGLTQEAGRLFCEQTEFVNNYKFSLALAVDPEHSPVHLQDLTLLGYPDRMGYPYSTAQWGGPIVPARGIVFLETPWYQAEPIVLSRIHVRQMLRGVSMSQDASVGLIRLDECQFEDCYERAVSLPNLILYQCRIQLPDAYPTGPLGLPGGYGQFEPARFGCLPDPARGNPAEDLCLPGHGPTDIEQVRTEEIYGATGFQIVSRSSSYLGTGQQALSTQVGLATPLNSNNVQLDGNQFLDLATGVVLRGPFSLGSSQRLDNNFFQGFGVAIRAEGALNLNLFTCNRFNAQQWPGALALYHDRANVGELINEANVLHGLSNDQPCGNTFYNFSMNPPQEFIQASVGDINYNALTNHPGDLPYNVMNPVGVQVTVVPNTPPFAVYCLRAQSSSQELHRLLTPFDPRLVVKANHLGQSTNAVQARTTAPESDTVCFSPPVNFNIRSYHLGTRGKGILFHEVTIPGLNVYQSAAEPDKCPPYYSAVPRTSYLSRGPAELSMAFEMTTDSTLFKWHRIVRDSIFYNGMWHYVARYRIVTQSPLGDTLSVLDNPAQYNVPVAGSYMVNAIQPPLHPVLGQTLIPDTSRIYDLSKPGAPSLKLAQLGKNNLYVTRFTYENDGRFRFIIWASNLESGRTSIPIGLIGLMDTTFRIIAMDTIMPRDTLIQIGGYQVEGSGWAASGTHIGGLANLSNAVFSGRHYRVSYKEFHLGRWLRAELVSGKIELGRSRQRRYPIESNGDPVRANARLVGPMIPLRDGGVAVLNATQVHEQINRQIQVSILDSNDNLVRVIRVAPVINERTPVPRVLRWSTMVPLSDTSILVQGIFQDCSVPSCPLTPIYRILTGIPVAPVQAVPPPGLIPDAPLTARRRQSAPRSGTGRVTIYPNPARDQITLTGDLPPGTWLELYALTGQRLMRLPAHKAQATAPLPATLRPGLYHWQVVIGASGQRLASGRLVCE